MLPHSPQSSYRLQATGCRPQDAVWSLQLAACSLSYGLVVLLVVSPAATAAGEIRAGVAHENFELPSKVPLAGYSRRKGRPSQGLHDPVGVRALVIQDGTTAAARGSCDLLIVDERLFE